jgi:flagellin-like protein
MKSKRGISPVIATVLLVVIAIALFLIIFFWIRGFQKEVITKYGTPIETQCTTVKYDVTYSGGTVQVSNAGSTTIYKAQIVSGSQSKYTGQISPASSATQSITCSGGKIKVIPYLLGTTQAGQNREYACSNQAKTISCS